MTSQEHTTNDTHRERPLGHLAAAVARRTRRAVRAALADAGISHRDLRLLAAIDREPQTVDALTERRARREIGRRHRHGAQGHTGHHGRDSHAMHHDHGVHGHGDSARCAPGARDGHRHGRVSLEGRLAHLEERGLVATDASGILTLTEAGTALRHTARETLAAVKERYSAGVPDADLETTRRTLRTIAHNLA